MYVPGWVKRNIRRASVVECGESVDHSVIVESIRSIDVDAVGQVVALELHLSDEREVDFRSPYSSRVAREVCSRIPVTDQESMQTLVST
jgi:hypothetical protein